MYASMPRGNDQNISFNSATSQAKCQCAERRPKNSAGSSTGRMGVACFVVLGISVCCCFRWLAVAWAVTTLNGRPRRFPGRRSGSRYRDRLAGCGPGPGIASRSQLASGAAATPRRRRRWRDCPTSADISCSTRRPQRIVDRQRWRCRGELSARAVAQHRTCRNRSR